jgi:phosphoserine phosphatase
VLDLDGVVIRKEFLLEVARKAGVYRSVWREFHLGANGGVDWIRSLETRLRLLRGVPRETVIDAVDSMRPALGAIKLTRLLAERGWVIAIVTGGFDVLEKTLRDNALVYHYYYSHRLIFRNNKLWWYEPGYKDKKDVVQKLKDELKPELTVAIGDGWNDIGMFSVADIAVGFNVKCGVKPFVDLEATSFRSLWKLLRYL